MIASFDTRIDGDPESVRAVARWLTGALGAALDDVDRTLKNIAGSIDNEWRGETASAAADAGWGIERNITKALDNIADAASAINTFARHLEDARVKPPSSGARRRVRD